MRYLIPQGTGLRLYFLQITNNRIDNTIAVAYIAMPSTNSPEPMDDVPKTRPRNARTKMNTAMTAGKGCFASWRVFSPDS